MTRLTNVVARPKVNRYPSGRPRNFTLAIEVAVEREYQTRGEVKGRRVGGGKEGKRKKEKKRGVAGRAIVSSLCLDRETKFVRAREG